MDFTLIFIIFVTTLSLKPYIKTLILRTHVQDFHFGIHLRQNYRG